MAEANRPAGLGVRGLIALAFALGLAAGIAVPGPDCTSARDEFDERRAAFVQATTQDQPEHVAEAARIVAADPLCFSTQEREQYEAIDPRTGQLRERT